jgi:glutamate-ammonia-ligase adenylyltransferase
MNFREQLERLERASPVIRDALRRRPEWQEWLRERVQHPMAETGLPDAWKNWSVSSAPQADVLASLRTFRFREHIDIAFRDLAGLASFEETVQRLSRLAEWIITVALKIAWQEMASSKPAAISDGDGFAVIAMGKLGGGELNYSSDVDLIFCRRRSDDDQEVRFFTRLGERLVQMLGQPGPDGLLYRTDMRLRPHGNTGSLVPTIDSLENYYESWGEAWERQALIKARPIAGDEHLRDRFRRFAERFVFARQMDDSSLEEIKQVKHRSEKEYACAGDRFHIKQGAGGIRDIEFYVQYLQLIAGNRRPEVRSASTLAAIRALAGAKSLLEGENSQLSLAYVFMRTIEHRLQLRTLTPRVLIPENPDELELLARGLDFGDSGSAAVGAFKRTLDGHRTRVRSILERIYLTPGTLRPREREEEFAQLLSERTPKERVRGLLCHYGFRDADKAWQNIRLMGLGPAGRLLPPGERRAFLEVVFPILEVLRASCDPDLALHHLESFAAASGNRVSFLRALASRRAHLQRLANLLALSKLCHQILMRHPEYFDGLARGIHLDEGRSKPEMFQELEERVRRASDREAGEVVRRYRQREMIRIAYRDVAGLAGPQEISAELSELAEACLLAGLELAARGEALGRRGGGPSGDYPLTLHIIALGKLGSRQLHYSSDLDLLILYDDPPLESSPETRSDWQLCADGCVERLLELLGGVTPEGVAYRIDLRLRPEGTAGLLARSWSSFLDHARRYMQPWERMALVRGRVVSGSEETKSRWSEAMEEIVYDFVWDKDAVGAIRHLKRRIESESNKEDRVYVDFKFGSGGIADFEFLVQFLQVLHGHKASALRTPQIAETLSCLRDMGVISPQECQALKEAHQFQRLLENHYQLVEEWASREVSRESPVLERLARNLGCPGSTPGEARRALLDEWDCHARMVRSLVEKLFY